MIKTTVLGTPIGPLALLERDGVLVASGFTEDPRDLHARLHATLRGEELVSAADLGDIEKAHAAYFDGDPSALDAVPVHQPGTARLEKLWEQMRRVPAGETVTYGELADMAGIERGARVAGAACARNLIAPAIPCHRILGSNGKLHGYLYGLERKEWLLSHEAR